ncbi:unnamed protein product [Bemisia tabaci]|uniref:PRELI/MSF1 domain-containing protein n=1 Tax=Bemisia tabaci TaxID=7038 RepID=A0A9P0AMD5_BEMTA|nr:PREDICTED: protein slowmo-like [Bemisia tabaci]CAH0394662.1 unnamed protein product [Bemisia tabaci]
MKIWTSEHTFNHPWEKVVEAAWRKYPNPMNPAVTGIDVVDRQVSDGVLITKRLIASQWGLPGWAVSIVGPTSVCYAKEYSTVNPEKKTMELKSRNLTFGSMIAVDETLRYESHPDDASKTKLSQEAVVTVQGIPLCSYVENLLTSKISHNANKGRQAIEWVIDKIETEVKDLKNSAVKNTDEILMNTKKSFGEITTAARKSIDDLHIGNQSSQSYPEV